MGEEKRVGVNRIAQGWSWFKWLTGDKTPDEIVWRLDHSGLPLDMRNQLKSLINIDDVNVVRERVYELFRLQQQPPALRQPDNVEELVPMSRKQRKRKRKLKAKNSTS